jgi:hypothetical protein
LATFALPLTAPTCGSRNACASRPIASRSSTVSPSTRTTSSVRAAAIPVLSAAGLPALSCRMSRTLGSRSDATIAAVSSVEPSSTTITHTPG